MFCTCFQRGSAPRHLPLPAPAQGRPGEQRRTRSLAQTVTALQQLLAALQRACGYRPRCMHLLGFSQVGCPAVPSFSTDMNAPGVQALLQFLQSGALPALPTAPPCCRGCRPQPSLPPAGALSTPRAGRWPWSLRDSSRPAGSRWAAAWLSRQHCCQNSWQSCGSSSSRRQEARPMGLAARLCSSLAARWIKVGRASSRLPWLLWRAFFSIAGSLFLPQLARQRRPHPCCCLQGTCPGPA